MRVRSPVIPVPVKVVSAPFVKASDVSPVLLLRFRVVRAVSQVPVKVVRALELRLRSVIVPIPVPEKLVN